MRSISIAIFCTASIWGVAPAAQAVKVTFETLVSTDTKTHGGQSILVPLSPGIKQPMFEYRSPSIDRQDVVFVGLSRSFVSKTEKDASGKTIDTHLSSTGLYYRNALNRKPQLITREINKFVQFRDGMDISDGSYDYRSIDIKDKRVAATKLLTQITNQSDGRIGPWTDTTSLLFWQQGRRAVLNLGGCTYSVREGGGAPSGDGVSLGFGQASVMSTGSQEGCPTTFAPSPYREKVEQLISHLSLDKKQILYRAASNPDDLLLDEPSLSARGNAVVFFDKNLYLQQDGNLRTLMAIGQPLPDIGKIQGFCGSDFDGKNIVFCGRSDRYDTGIYLKVGDQLKTVVTSRTQVPGQKRTFSGVRTPKVSGENILFMESDDSNVYVRFQNQITRIVGIGSMINGKTVTHVNLGKRPISGNQVVFAVVFQDGSSSIVKAKLSA
jgi:hypothetical protein